MSAIYHEFHVGLSIQYLQHKIKINRQPNIRIKHAKRKDKASTGNTKQDQYLHKTD